MSHEPYYPRWHKYFLIVCMAIAVSLLLFVSRKLMWRMEFRWKFEPEVHEQIERETAPLKARIEALEKRK